MPKRSAASKPTPDTGAAFVVHNESPDFAERAPFVQRDVALAELAELVGHLGTVHRSQLPGLIEDALKRIQSLRAL